MACFVLDRFSDDQTKAFLKCEKYTKDTSKEMVFRRLHEKQVVGSPLFSIQVREVVNDTGLPELHVDEQKEEISFDWKGMLDQLLVRIFGTLLNHISILETCLGSTYSLDVFQESRHPLRQARLTPNS